MKETSKPAIARGSQPNRTPCPKDSKCEHSFFTYLPNFTTDVTSAQQRHIDCYTAYTHFWCRAPAVRPC